MIVSLQLRGWSGVGNGGNEEMGPKRAQRSFFFFLMKIIPEASKCSLEAFIT